MKPQSNPNLRHAIVALALCSATALSGCTKDQMPTGSVSRQSAAIDQMSPGQLTGMINALSAAYEKNPGDKATGLAFAKALQTDGRNDQALAVMKKLAISHSRDQEVLAAYGKALASAGQFESALDAVRRAQTPERPDWRLLSAEGAILDQTGQTAEARELYRKALDVQPGEPSILSNLGMSHVLEGDLKQPKPICARLCHGPVPTIGSGKIWLWLSACKAAMMRRSRLPRNRFLHRKLKPISPICALSWPRKTHGPILKAKAKTNQNHNFQIYLQLHLQVDDHMKNPAHMPGFSYLKFHVSTDGNDCR